MVGNSLEAQRAQKDLTFQRSLKTTLGMYQKTNSTPVYLLMERTFGLRTEWRAPCVNVF